MRKEVYITIQDENRDQGKTFVVREWDVVTAERWAVRAIFALSHAGANIGEVLQLGMAGLIGVGLQNLINVQYEEAAPLWDELLTCARICPNPNDRGVTRDIDIMTDIEEVSTLGKLKGEAIRLHVDFFIPGANSPTQPTSESPPESSTHTRTSRPQSGRSSRPGKQP